MATLDEIYAVVIGSKEKIDKIEKHLERLNGKVGGLDVRVAVIEEWKRCVGEPRAKDAEDNRVAIAKMAVLGSSAGGIFGLITLLCKIFLG